MNIWSILVLLVPFCSNSPVGLNNTTAMMLVTTPMTSNRSNVVTTDAAPSSIAPTSNFDMASFCGGAVLTVGLTGTAYFGIKFYKARNPDYRHI